LFASYAALYGRIMDMYGKAIYKLLSSLQASSPVNC